MHSGPVPAVPLLAHAFIGMPMKAAAKPVEQITGEAGERLQGQEGAREGKGGPGRAGGGGKHVANMLEAMSALHQQDRCVPQPHGEEPFAPLEMSTADLIRSHNRSCNHDRHSAVGRLLLKGPLQASKARGNQCIPYYSRQQCTLLLQLLPNGDR